MNYCYDGKEETEATELQIARIAEWIAENRQDLFISDIKKRLRYMKIKGYNFENKTENPFTRLEICKECGFFIKPNSNVNKSYPELPIICEKCNKILKIWGIEGKLRAFLRNKQKIEGFSSIEEAQKFIDDSKERIVADVIISHDVIDGYIIVETFSFIFPFGSIDKEIFFAILEEF